MTLIGNKSFVMGCMLPYMLLLIAFRQVLMPGFCRVRSKLLVFYDTLTDMNVKKTVSVNACLVPN